MDKVIKRSNKATLIAAVLIITGATAIFGTYAADEGIAPQCDCRCPMMQQELTEEQKAALEEAKALFEAGDREAAREILDAAGIKPPHKPGQKSPRPEFMKNLTEEQREALKQAQELFQAGDKEGAIEILEAAGIEKPEKRPGNGFGRKPWQQFKPQNNGSGNDYE